MTEEKFIDRLKWWILAVPIYLAYRLIWLAAKTGHPTARDIYSAAWRAQLDLPRIEGLSDA